jgi:hypothetical protein
MKTEIFLNTSLKSLGLSIRFCEDSAQMGFRNIGEILKTPPEVMIKMDGFNYHWLAELSEALNKEGLLHLLQPLPGSSPD